MKPHSYRSTSFALKARSRLSKLLESGGAARRQVDLCDRLLHVGALLPGFVEPELVAEDYQDRIRRAAAAIGGFARKCLHFRSLDRARLFRCHRISLVNSAARRPLNGHDRNRRYVRGAPAAERPIVRRWYVTRTRSAAISDLLSRVAVGVSCDNCGRIGFSGSKQERTSTSWACPSMHAFCEGAGLPRSRTT